MYAVSTAHITTVFVLYDRDPDALSEATVLNPSGQLSQRRKVKLLVAAFYLPVVNVSTTIVFDVLQVFKPL